MRNLGVTITQTLGKKENSVRENVLPLIPGGMESWDNNSCHPTILDRELKDIIRKKTTNEKLISL